MKTIILSLITITACLLLTGCGGGGGGGSGGGGGPSNGGGPSLPAGVELSISPFAGGLRIRWHNLPAIEKAGGIYIHLNLTSGNPPQLDRRRIAIEDFSDDSNDVDGLIDGTAYRLVEVRVELAGNVSRVIDNITWSEPWEAKTNALDQEGNGIVVGTNYDGDGRADSVDTDDDNDGVNNTRADGTEWDLCSARDMGELGWLSNGTSDYDNDGCRDKGMANDGYGEDEDDDNDNVLDRDEAASRCVQNENCDNDDLDDSEDACPAGQSNWNNDGTNDFDGDGCRNDEDPDGDNDGILNVDEETGCELKIDCDGDGVDDINEVMGCAMNPNCDGDGEPDNRDIDDDGDGLIEIHNASELDAVRYVLDGTGFKANETAMLDRTGCGDGTMTACNGYELVRDISLTDYIAANYPMLGWQPIAPDGRIGDSNAECIGDDFMAIFDGNGFEITGLWIDRPQQDCVGLFGQLEEARIINLGVVADRIIGEHNVGGLVGGSGGTGRSSEIIQSYVVSNIVKGVNSVGGLVGVSDVAVIIQSYAVSNETRGRITSQLGTGSSVGGLVGRGNFAKIIQSYAVSNSVGRVQGSAVGGLVGLGKITTVIQSYAVSGGISGRNSVGGLVGDGEGGTATASYWDTDTSGETNDDATGSSGRTTTALRSPTDYGDTGIYSTWDDGAMVDGINVNTTIWCDEDAGGMIEDDERRDNTHANGDNRIWDFGTATDYPALRCTGDSLADQRAWWSLNSENKPALDQDRLNAYLDGTLP